MLQVMPYYNAIGENTLTPTHTGLTRFGFNPAFGTTMEDVWLGGGTFVFPTIAQQMRVVSSSNSDNISGTGAQRVIVDYLDGNYTPHNIIVDMNGTTPVNTVATDIFRVNDLRCYTVGTAGATVGTISLSDLAGSVFYRYIQPTYTASRGSQFTVPLGKTLYLESFYVGLSDLTATQTARLTLKGTYDSLTNRQLTPGIFFMPFAEVAMTNGSFDRVFLVPVRIPATTDVKISIISVTGTGSVEAGYRGWIE
jgi:hypothetical protein